VTLDGVHLALRGAHQVENARVAIALLDTIDGKGMRVDERAVRTGLTNAVWPGRLEQIEYEGCRIILDAAHNPAGARALADYLRTTLNSGVTLVFGAMRDKDVAEMLAPLAGVARVIVCTTASTSRAMTADAIADVARPLHGAVLVEPDPIQAVTRACRSGGTVVVAGSIFLIGPVREMLARA
jgi:dihydrofolate synthase/folylpolyglutamate synthase